MKRKELEKLPVLRATTAMLEQAEKESMVQTGYFRKELRYEHEYYARCKRFDRILKVAIYLTKNLAAGGRKPVYELFLDYDAQDFLTYSFMTMYNAQALFSSRAISPEQLTEMRAFHDTTMENLKTRCKPLHKLRLKWLNCLY